MNCDPARVVLFAALAFFVPGPFMGMGGWVTWLLSLIMLDASLVFFAQQDRNWSLAVAALLFPAVVLGKRLAIT